LKAEEGDERARGGLTGWTRRAWLVCSGLGGWGKVGGMGAGRCEIEGSERSVGGGWWGRGCRRGRRASGEEVLSMRGSVMVVRVTHSFVQLTILGKIDHPNIQP
jgi:hypothetical protein